MNGKQQARRYMVKIHSMLLTKRQARGSKPQIIIIDEALPVPYTIGWDLGKEVL